jgi:hypothetical protein
MTTRLITDQIADIRAGIKTAAKIVATEPIHTVAIEMYQPEAWQDREAFEALQAAYRIAHPAKKEPAMTYQPMTSAEQHAGEEN